MRSLALLAVSSGLLLGGCPSSPTSGPSAPPPSSHAAEANEASAEPAEAEPAPTEAEPTPAQAAPAEPRRLAVTTESHQYIEMIAFIDARTLLVDPLAADDASPLWNVDTLEPIERSTLPFRWFTWALSADRATILYNVDGEDYEHGTIAMVDAATGAVNRTLTLRHAVDAQPIAVSADGAWLATSTAQPTEPAVVTVWGLPGGKRKRRLTLLDDTGYDSAYWVDVALTRRGDTLVVVATNDVDVGEATADIWNPSTGKRTRLPPGALEMDDDDFDLRASDTALGRTVAISPDDTRATTGLVDHAVRVWDMGTGKELRRLVHEDLVTAVAFSPTGDRIASAAAGKDVRLWDARSGTLLAAHPLRGRHARSIAFSPDGTTIAVAETNNVLLWSPAVAP